MRVVLDILKTHFTQLVRQELAKRELAGSTRITFGTFTRCRVDLDVAEKAAEQAGVVDERQVNGQ